MDVVKVVDEDISHKIDTQFIANQFSHIHHVGVLFFCTREGGDDDEWTDETGFRNIVIQLPYPEVQQLENAREMMLEKVRQRLGLSN